MKKILLAISLTALCGTSMAAGDAAAGKEKSAMCSACHGANGVGIGSTFPNLAGQKADYMVLQMKAFKDGSRKGANSAQMIGMVAALSEQDMADIAAYFLILRRSKVTAALAQIHLESGLEPFDIHSSTRPSPSQIAN